jgi:hypothetical protein
MVSPVFVNRCFPKLVELYRRGLESDRLDCQFSRVSRNRQCQDNLSQTFFSQEIELNSLGSTQYGDSVMQSIVGSEPLAPS